MHRALAALEALEATIKNAPTLAGDNVALGRVTNLVEDDLPAIDINIAEDSPTSETGADSLGFIDSLLRVYVDVHVSTVLDPRVALHAAYQLRSEIHVALMANDKLGFSWVHAVRPMGAEDYTPDLGSVRVGSMRTLFDIWYRTAYLSPEL